MITTDTLWIVFVAGTAAVLRSFLFGANMPVNCWGPTIGAKAVSYKTAVLLGLVGQTIGMIVFGENNYSAYGQFLTDWHQLQNYPLLTMYALMWVIVVPLLWHAAGIWQKIILPVYLGNVASTVGAALVFPGPRALNFGRYNSITNFSGLGAVFSVWVLAPALTLLLAATNFIFYRNGVFRGEDCFHRALWVLPVAAQWMATSCGLLLIYGIGSPIGTTVFQTTPQGVCIILAALGSAAAIVMSCGVKSVSYRLRTRIAPPAAVKRMNLLGLDDATVKELTAIDTSRDMKGWLQQLHTRCFQIDLSSPIASSDVLLRIHATAEEFEATAEEAFVPFQVVFCFFLSVAWGANNGHITMLIFETVRTIYASGTVPANVGLSVGLRCATATGMAIGTLLWGARLTTITGVQLAKMTPFRSNTVMGFTVQIVAILGIMDLRGAVVTYCLVSSVIAVGLVEGSSHVHWRLVYKTLVWWTFGFLLTMVVTTALVAQGMYAPSLISAAADPIWSPP